MRRRQLLRWGMIGLVAGMGMSACGRSAPPPVDEKAVRQQITERFNRAYGHWLALAEMTLQPHEDSTLNDARHRVYDVSLTAVVQTDVQQALAQLPDTPEGRAERLRLEGLRSLDALQKGQKITSKLRALVEWDPEGQRWQVVGLVRQGAPAGKKETGEAS